MRAGPAHVSGVVRASIASMTTVKAFMSDLLSHARDEQTEGVGTCMVAPPSPGDGWRKCSERGGGSGERGCPRAGTRLLFGEHRDQQTGESLHACS